MSSSGVPKNRTKSSRGPMIQPLGGRILNRPEDAGGFATVVAFAIASAVWIDGIRPKPFGQEASPYPTGKLSENMGGIAGGDRNRFRYRKWMARAELASASASIHRCSQASPLESGSAPRQSPTYPAANRHQSPAPPAMGNRRKAARASRIKA